MNFYKILLALCVFLGIHPLLSHAENDSTTRANNAEAGKHRLLVEIRKALNSSTDSDLDTLEPIVMKLRKEEGTFADDFAETALEICERLSETTTGATFTEKKSNSLKKNRLMTELASSALFGNKVPLQLRMKLLRYLDIHTPSLTTKLERAEWSATRALTVKYWLKTWNDIDQALKLFDFTDEPLLSVPPPRNANLPDGGTPEMIKDPVLKKQYLDALEHNKTKTENFRRMNELRMESKTFFNIAEHYVTRCYMTPPYEIDELRKLLDIFIGDAAVRDRMLKKVQEALGKKETGEH